VQLLLLEMLLLLVLEVLLLLRMMQGKGLTGSEA